jgi:23S rRNA pseudouridine2605 synthase
MERKIRLQVALAQLGFASRRGAVEIIKAGRVKVNGQSVFTPGKRVDLVKDKITLDGKKAHIQRKVYFILHKPKGVVTTVKDKFATKTVLDLFKPKNMRIYPVGRLDKDTTGILLLTNDGRLAYQLAHPKFGIKKVYRVRIAGQISQKKIEMLARGISLEGKKTAPCTIKVIAKKTETTELEIQLTEGRKRQIKKMFQSIDKPVITIARVAFGPLKLGHLPPGKWRPLKSTEIVQLRQLFEQRTKSQFK